LSLLSQLELLIQDIQQYDKEIERLVKSHPDSEIFLALKGVGTNLAVRIMVEFGDDRTYYPHANALQCEAGTAPVIGITLSTGAVEMIKVLLDVQSIKELSFLDVLRLLMNYINPDIRFYAIEGGMTAFLICFIVN
jgi:hypothetical protein